MKYYSEDTVMDILDKIERENGHSVALSFPNFSELKSINIPDKHGQLIDRDAVLKEYNQVGYMWQEVPRIAHEEFVHIVYNAPVVLERTT